MELHHRGTETQSFIMHMTDQRDSGNVGKNKSDLRNHLKSQESRSAISKREKCKKKEIRHSHHIKKPPTSNSQQSTSNLQSLRSKV